MTASSNSVWKTERREAARSRILEVAWAFVREQGLAALSLRDLAGRVGLAPASLYSYFDSKNAIFDAMFAQGYQQFLDVQREPLAELGPELRRLAHEYMTFCTQDPARYQLLFQRTIPGFEPSAESMALAQQAYRQLEVLTKHGFTAQDLDLLTVVDTATDAVAQVGACFRRECAHELGATRAVG